MTIHSLLTNYYQLGCLTKQNMKVRKAEFLTEVILSLFIVAIHIESQSPNPTVAMSAIAITHSFNAARAFEAYKEAQIQTNAQQET